MSTTADASCPSGDIVFQSSITGTTYQWQMDDGSGYVNIGNNNNFSGTQSFLLQIKNASTNWYGYKFRCLVDGNMAVFENHLKFETRWTGIKNNAWKDAANWNCGELPDANTDVIINSDVPNFSQVSSNTSCRSIDLNPAAFLSINPGFNLTVMGH